MEQFLRVMIYVTNEDEDTDPLLAKTYKRVAYIPFNSLAYISEGLERFTTEIVLKDGEQFIATEHFEVIFEAWQTWYNNESHSFIHFTRSN